MESESESELKNLSCPESESESKFYHVWSRSRKYFDPWSRSRKYSDPWSWSRSRKKKYRLHSPGLKLHKQNNSGLVFIYLF